MDRNEEIVGQRIPRQSVRVTSEDNLVPPPEEEHSTCWQRTKWFCETRLYLDTVQCFRILCLVILFFLSWGILYSVLGDEYAGPTSDLICLAVLFVAGKIAAVILEIIKIPGILGMLGMGILLRNIGYIDLSEEYLHFTAFLRQIALINILLPAALSLDPKILMNMSGMVVALSIVPAAVEIIAMCIFAKFLLDLPWLWSLLLGLIMGAVSPAVVIPCLFELEKQGYGHKKGINTLLVAASVIDDIECISLYGVVLGIITSTGTCVEIIFCIGTA